eukprot:scaffold1658_cov115-Isochrysis_galbana.AAC.5
MQRKKSRLAAQNVESGDREAVCGMRYSRSTIAVRQEYTFPFLSHSTVQSYIDSTVAVHVTVQYISTCGHSTGQ